MKKNIWLWLGIIALLLGSVYVPIISAQPAGETIRLSLGEFGYTDLKLNGLYGNASIWVPFQSDWQIGEDIQLEVTYMATPLLNEEEAALTVLVENQEVTSIRPIGDGQEHTFSVVIPSEQVTEFGFNLEFEGYLRITDDECEDTDNTGQWLIVKDSTDLGIPLDPAATAPQLDQLPQAILVQGGQADPPPVIFVLPDNFDAADMTLAAKVASRLGVGVSDKHLPFHVETTSTLTELQKQQANLVVVGELANQPLIDELSVALPVPPDADGFVSGDNQPIPEADGVIQIFASPWATQRNILLVSGATDAALDIAGEAFTDRATFSSLDTDFEFVNALVELPELALSPPWLTQNTTFRQLGQTDRTVSGIGIKDTYYFFRQPAGWHLESGAQLVLHLAFSPALRTDESYAVIYINNIYIGTVNIDPDDGDIWIGFELPAQALNEKTDGSSPQQLDLQVSIANLLPTDSCEQVNADASWTRIYADSYFVMPHTYAELPDLRAFPYPFVSDIENVPLTIVVPDDPTLQEIETALSVAAIMGQNALQNTDLQVTTSTAVNEESQGNNNLIVIGTRARQPLIDQFLAALPPLPAEGIYETLAIPETGLIHTLVSPWNAERAILLLYADGETGLELASQAIYEVVPPVTETGSAAMVRADQDPLIVYRELGLAQPVFTAPEITQAETTGQSTVAQNPTATAVSPDAAAASDEDVQTPVIENSAADNADDELSDMERIILIMTAFLIVLISIAALGRIIFRLTE